jgi:hypothetical protein
MYGPPGFSWWARPSAEHRPARSDQRRSGSQCSLWLPEEAGNRVRVAAGPRSGGRPPVGSRPRSAARAFDDAPGECETEARAAARARRGRPGRTARTRARGPRGPSLRPCPPATSSPSGERNAKIRTVPSAGVWRTAFTSKVWSTRQRSPGVHNCRFAGYRPQRAGAPRDART